MSGSSPTARRHTVDFLFTLSLFGVFAVMALLVTFLGSHIYKNIVRQSENTWETGTSLSYIREKIRQNDILGQIRILQTDGSDVLAIESSADGLSFLTYIYWQNGELKELYQLADHLQPLSSGQTILTLQDFGMEQLSDTLFHFTAVDSSGQSEELFVTIHSTSREAA